MNKIFVFYDLILQKLVILTSEIENMEVLDIIAKAYSDYAGYLWSEITQPHWGNYFYWLIGVSLFFFALELWKPWRPEQPIFRKDFWLDFFYMFFNFFLFSLIIYNAASDLVTHWVNGLVIGVVGINLESINPMNGWPMWAILLTGFVVRDFIQWWTHRLLHFVPRLWEFHKVHHSVQEMGFAAHLRYHWMETVVYRTIEYIPLALLGIGLYDFFIIHLFTLAWGHFNHSNITVSGRVTGGILGGLIGVVIAFGLWDTQVVNAEMGSWTAFGLIGLFISIGIFLFGPLMRKVFNSPEMHIWHHADKMPTDKPYGVNFGLTLAIWDYLFGQAYVPADGKDIKLGFEEVDRFPSSFWGQFKNGLR